MTVDGFLMENVRCLKGKNKKKQQVQVQYRNGAKEVLFFGIKNVLFSRKDS
jgi:hypothetical protein